MENTFNPVKRDNKLTVDNASDNLEILYAGEGEEKYIYQIAIL